MSLFDRVAEDVKVSMKAQTKERTSVLRMLLSELKYAKAAVGMDKELGDEATIQCISSYYKKLDKSLADYPDEAQKEKIRAEMKIVSEYLPKKAGEAEVRAAVDEVVKAATDKNFGLLMKQVMGKLGTAADGKLVSQILKEKLS
jgi:uncharacterized protein YqeY